MKEKLQRLFFILIILSASYLISVFLGRYGFENNSYKANPRFIADVRYDLDSVFEKISRVNPFLANNELERSKRKALELAQSGVLKQIAPGIKAAETAEAGYYRLDIDDPSYGEYKTYIVGGKIVKIKTKNGVAPSKETLEIVARYAK
jgi:hypothetical protein